LQVISVCSKTRNSNKEQWITLNSGRKEYRDLTDALPSVAERAGIVSTEYGPGVIHEQNVPLIAYYHNMLGKGVLNCIKELTGIYHYVLNPGADEMLCTRI